MKGDQLCPGRGARCYCPTVLAAALACARGAYQRRLVLGLEALSGAGVWGARYAVSRRALLERMTAAGVVWREQRVTRGRRVLILG